MLLGWLGGGGGGVRTESSGARASGGGAPRGGAAQAAPEDALDILLDELARRVADAEAADAGDRARRLIVAVDAMYQHRTKLFEIAVRLGVVIWEGRERVSAQVRGRKWKRGKGDCKHNPTDNQQTPHLDQLLAPRL